MEFFLNPDQNNVKRRETKEVDVEAQMKRKFNRRRKEIQLHLHKANLIAWISHSNYVNRKLNDSDLMRTALTMLPKNQKQCYPSGNTDIDYFKQITAWYRTTMELPNKDMYCTFKTRPKLLTSLALQMKFKKALCRRDYVLIYVALLRAIGIECRVVQSLVCAPMAPPKNELMSLSKKPDETAAVKKPTSKTSSKSKKSSKSSSSSRKKSSSKKSKKSTPKIPQLDGADDPPGRPKRTLRLKGPAKNVDVEEESFVNIQKETRKSATAAKSKTALNPAEKLKVDSPKRQTATVTAKSSKSQVASTQPAKKSTLDVVFSPRRLRSRSKSAEPKQSNSQEENGASSSNKPQLKSLNNRKRQAVAPTEAESVVSKKTKQKDQLEVVFSPRRLRSRSKSNEPDKPNLKGLSNKEVSTKVPTKRKSQESSAQKAKVVPKKKAKVSIAKTEDEDDDSDSSAKLFKTRPSTSAKSTSSKKIDRRVLSSDDDEEAKTADAFSSPTKTSKGIDIWVEVYSEKDERWISIDVFRNKIDNVKEIVKTATHPLIYVFAFNNDKSIKDISARYCTNLNTTVRKMRVDSKYLNSILSLYAVPRTRKDFKENEELNGLQFAQEMPKAISEWVWRKITCECA